MPVQTLLLVSVLAPHWLGEKAEKLSVPPGGTTHISPSASSNEPTRASPKPPEKYTHDSSICSSSFSPSSSTRAPTSSPLSSVVEPWKRSSASLKKPSLLCSLPGSPSPSASNQAIYAS